MYLHGNHITSLPDAITRLERVELLEVDAAAIEAPSPPVARWLSIIKKNHILRVHEDRAT
ncbi:hypothetical protein GF325_08580 [Candidatus Bathyarchaeota archaeon]|nr:hypothetical protein [Candidatus Bathyarchaeota archaeon]